MWCWQLNRERILHCVSAYSLMILSTPVSVLYDGWVGRVRHRRDCLEIAWGCPLACVSNLITMQVRGGEIVLIVIAIMTAEVTHEIVLHCLATEIPVQVTIM